MECQSSDSKKLFKVFDGSKRKRSRKKEVDTISVATDDSNSGCQVNPGRTSNKASLHDLPIAQAIDGLPDGELIIRKRGSSPSLSRSPHEGHRAARSPRRHRRPTREGISLALKAGMVSTPRSVSPPQGEGPTGETQDKDSLIYAFLEEAIKRDKKKQSRRHEERRHSRDRDRDRSENREHRHRHRRRHDVPSRDREARVHEKSPTPVIDQTILLETFAKICAQMSEKTAQHPKSTVPRTQSHKSLQCEVASRRDICEERHEVRKMSHERSREASTPTRIRSQDNFQPPRKPDKAREDCCYYEKEGRKYSSKMDINRKRPEDDHYHSYPPETVATRTCINRYGDRPPDYRDYDRERRYEEEKRRYCEQKTSRSFETHRENYDYEKDRRTVRSDTKDKHYDNKYYDKHRDPLERNFPTKERSRRNLERCDRNSVVSRDDEFRERDRYSERERDSGLSVADGETSTISGKSNYLRVVKQEISEQREAMDKMMKLWKELMRCFKGVSQSQVKDNSMNESVENVRESAAAQLRLWRECMRRYETVARDVGDTDARLMEEINKQRSEMAEMAGMWQECLQRYRDMSNDFNTLKQKTDCTARGRGLTEVAEAAQQQSEGLSAPESPTRLPAAPPPLVCAEGEGSIPSPQYRMPANYSQMCPPPSYPPGSVLRGRASAPPAWWWGGEQESPRRRSSPDSRGSRERDTRHRHKDARDESRYKGKSSKPSAARSEHKHRKR